MGSKNKRDSGGVSPPLESGRPTVRPTVSAEELASQPAARRSPVGIRAVREPQVTLTNEFELEQARLKSIGTPPQSSPADPHLVAGAQMRECLGLGDYAGALAHAETILAWSPEDAEAIQVANECRQTLGELYEAKLGALDRVPFVVVAREELRWLSIDHRAGFLLSHVDGVSSLETILDVSGMPRLEALRILVELVQKRVVALR